MQRDIPDFALVVGVPARQIGWISTHGERLKLPLTGSASALCEYSGEIQTRWKKSFKRDHLEMFPSIDLEVQEMFINNKIKSLIGAVLTRGKYILLARSCKIKGAFILFAGRKSCISVATETGAL